MYACSLWVTIQFGHFPHQTSLVPHLDPSLDDKTRKHSSRMPTVHLLTVCVGVVVGILGPMSRGAGGIPDPPLVYLPHPLVYLPLWYTISSTPTPHSLWCAPCPLVYPPHPLVFPWYTSPLHPPPYIALPRRDLGPGIPTHPMKGPGTRHHTPLPWTDTRCWKHYLPSTSVSGGNKLKSTRTYILFAICRMATVDDRDERLLRFCTVKFPINSFA